MGSISAALRKRTLSGILSFAPAQHGRTWAFDRRFLARDVLSHGGFAQGVREALITALQQDSCKTPLVGLEAARE